jgi:hypothetical protein
LKKQFITPGILLIAVSIALGFPLSLIPGAQTATVSSNTLHPSSTLSVRSSALNGVSKHELSLEERVSYHWAIEQVYWKHKLWPSENQEPKPRLEDVLTSSALWQKVEDTLRKSNVLEQRYKHIITAEQLQAEMERMARQTRQPELLEELWSALGNDPYVIAECLARPLLVDRLIQNWYGSDEQLHRELKARAASALHSYTAPAQMRQMGGQYTESEWLRVESKPSQVDHALASTDSLVMKLSPAEWDEAINKLTRTFAEPGNPDNRAECISCSNTELVNRAVDGEALPTDRVSSIQEDNQRFYVTAVLSRSNDRVKIARVEWRKTDFDQWWEAARNQFEAKAQSPGLQYQLPAVTQATCIDDTWKPTKLLPEGVYGSKAVWTGTEMIIWGGSSTAGGGVNTGARYNPATDSWTTISATDAPYRRNSHTAVWTGTEMIVWGGCSTTGHVCGLNSGGRYNPLTDTWRQSDDTTWSAIR